ncbi:MAG: AbrB/MazE/SpoVT family DNA-binding domain-containing protein [Oscillospiraceae bacterium]|nr:AbrB/MazE/SpoVT family DNA-binding domain-containing protein [Oscillospiraceae bacterium]
MKATGIVRRIDDLGRVVIPKEIRRTMRIREGAPLEIYTTKDGEVIFKKYSQLNSISDFAGELCESLSKATGCMALVTDRDVVVAVSGAPKRELGEKPISGQLEDIMESRQVYQRKEGETPLPVTGDNGKYAFTTAAPILSEGDVLGCVLLGGEGGKASSETAYKLAETAAGFLGRHMES